MLLKKMNRVNIMEMDAVAVSKICRLCLAGGSDLLPIFIQPESEEDVVPLAFRIFSCVCVEVAADDGLPSRICQRCLSHVNSWYEFKQVCDGSQEMLKEWLSYTSKPHEKTITIKQEPVDEDDGAGCFDEPRDSSITQESAVEGSTAAGVDTSTDEHVGMPVVHSTHSLLVHTIKNEPMDHEPSLDVDEESLFYDATADTTTEMSGGGCEMAEEGEVTSMVGVGSGVAVVEGGKEKDQEEKDVMDKSEDMIAEKTKDMAEVTHNAAAEDDQTNKTSQLLLPKEITVGVLTRSTNAARSTKTVDVPDDRRGRFSCQLCPRTFQHRVSLLSHQKSHKFVCLYCGKRFSSSSTLWRHTRLHTGHKPWTCPTCFKAYPNRSEYQRHRFRCSPDAYRPKGLSASVPIAEELVRVELKLGQDVPQTVSDVSSDDIKNAESEVAEVSETYQNVNRIQAAPSPALGGIRNIHSCFICQQEFPTRSSLLEHRRTHGLFKCHKCNKTFPGGTSLSNHLRTHNIRMITKSFQCMVCKKTFRHKDSLMEHRLTHTQTLPAVTITKEPVPPPEVTPQVVNTVEKVEDSAEGQVCCVCQRWFRTNAILNRHMVTHSKLKLFSCNICNIKMGYASSLHKHLKNFHQLFVDYKDLTPNFDSLALLSHGRNDTIPNNFVKTVKPEPVKIKQASSFSNVFSCNICMKRFSQKIFLLNHIHAVHEPAKTYKCSYCPQAFNKLRSMQNHERIHRAVPSQFSCSVCFKSYPDLKTLNLHKGMHNSFQVFTCDVCGETLNGLRSWTAHRASHVVETGFACDLCTLTFTTEFDLNRHKQMHHNIKLKIYTCALCKNSYSSSSALSKHKKKYHGAFGKIRNIVSVTSPNPKEEYSCNFCRETFNNFVLMRRHEQTHFVVLPNGKIILQGQDDIHGMPTVVKQEEGEVKLEPSLDHIQSASTSVSFEKPRPFSCQFCHKRYTNRSTLAKHQTFSCPASLESETSKSVQSEQKPVQKDNLSQSFRSPTNLSEQKPLLRSDVAQRVISERSGQSPQLIEPERFACALCPSTFDTKNGLVRHKGWHSRSPNAILKSDKFLISPSVAEGNTPVQKPSTSTVVTKMPEEHVCQVCKKHFSTALALSKHVVLHKAKPFPGSKSKALSDSQEQNITPSNNGSIWKCSYCQKVFGKQSYLLMHERLHTGELPFKCTQCPARFSRSTTLWKHKKKHLGVRQFACPICGKSFIHKYQMRLHLKVHTDVFPCDRCDNIFTSQHFLQSHVADSHS